MSSTASLYEAFLKQHDEQKWFATVESLLPSIHEVDRNATRVWFAFFPLTLRQALDAAEDRAALMKKMLILGDPLLDAQVDTSHRFLYGHRYWPQVKAAIVAQTETTSAPANLDLAAHIRAIADAAAKSAKADASLTLGIAAAGLMTLVQTGFEKFRSTPGSVQISRRAVSKSPETVLRERARDKGQGIFGFLRGEAKVYEVCFDENEPGARFPLIHLQHLTTAAAAEGGDHTKRDARCVPGEGVIPIECRSGACGTCWVGVLGGAENLTPVAPLERKKLIECGYPAGPEDRPLIRLACQAQGYGPVSFVMPPWNGMVGRVLASRDGGVQESAINR